MNRLHRQSMARDEFGVGLIRLGLAQFALGEGVFFGRIYGADPTTQFMDFNKVIEVCCE